MEARVTKSILDAQCISIIPKEKEGVFIYLFILLLLLLLSFGM
jgi:hypothetical protein